MTQNERARAPARSNSIAGMQDKRIVIEPHPNYGQPGPLAHKIFVALIKKHSDYGRPAPEEVSFTKREIMGLAGRKEWGGRDSAELSRAIDEIRMTSVVAFFKTERGKFYESRFNIFSHVLIERKNSHRDPIEACTITLAKPIVDFASRRALHLPQSLPDDAPRDDRAGALHAVVFPLRQLVRRAAQEAPRVPEAI